MHVLHHLGKIVSCEGQKAEVHSGYVASEARNKFGVLIFKPRVFREQMHFIENVLEILLGRFGGPQ